MLEHFCLSLLKSLETLFDGKVGLSIPLFAVESLLHSYSSVQLLWSRCWAALTPLSKSEVSLKVYVLAHLTLGDMLYLCKSSLQGWDTPLLKIACSSLQICPFLTQWRDVGDVERTREIIKEKEGKQDL